MSNKKIPDGFDFRFHPFCSNCPSFEVTCEKYFANNRTYLTIIQCENYSTCMKVAEHISREIRRNNNS